MVELHVTGMHCGGCAARITRALREVDATVEVAVDLSSKRVRVSGVSGEEARSAIERAGYAARVAVEPGV
jgi:copper chaperone